MALADDQAGDDVHRHRQRKDEGDAGDDARQRQGKRHGQESAQRTRAQCGRRSRQVRVDLADDRIDRQYHERKKDVRRAEHERGLREQQAHGLIDDAETDERLIDDAVRSEHDRPGECLDDHADRQRQDHGDEHQRQNPALRPRHRECGRVGENQAQHGRQKGNAQRAPEHREIEGIGEERDVARKRQLAVGPDQALHQKDQQGDGEQRA
jgi:hypothetical protein